MKNNFETPEFELMHIKRPAIIRILKDGPAVFKTGVLNTFKYNCCLLPACPLTTSTCGLGLLRWSGLGVVRLAAMDVAKSGESVF